MPVVKETWVRRVGLSKIIATDLGLTAWRSPAGLAAQIRSLQSATPRAGVKVALMALALLAAQVLRKGADDSRPYGRFGPHPPRGE